MPAFILEMPIFLRRALVAIAVAAAMATTDLLVGGGGRLHWEAHILLGPILIAFTIWLVDGMCHNPFLMADTHAEIEELVMHGFPRPEARRIAMENYDAVMRAGNRFIMIDIIARKMERIFRGVAPEAAHRMAMREYLELATGRH